MTTYFVTINSVESEFTDVYAAYKAIADAIYEDCDSVAALAVSDPRGEVWNSSDNSGADLERFYMEELSLIHDLKTLETVEGGCNGYPRGFETTLTGFDSWEQAKELADNNGLILVWLHRRDGWQSWERDSLASHPLDALERPEIFGYDFSSTESAKDFMQSELMDSSWEDLDSYEKILSYLDHFKRIADLLNNRKEDQVVLYNLDIDDEPTLCDKEMISYSDDCHEYMLGATTL